MNELINSEARETVKQMFLNMDMSNKSSKDSGTELGNMKAELLRLKGIDFIKKYDLVINKVIHENFYGKES